MPETQARAVPDASGPEAVQAHESAGQWGLRRGGKVAYWGAVAPLAALLPARLAYRVACAWGDLTFRMWPDRDAELRYLQHLRQLLDGDVIPEDVERFARDFWRFRACEVVDVMRLRGRAQSLAKLVDVRGREHLEAARAAGKGTILCTAHFGSYLSALSLLNASGFPLTDVGRWDWRYHSELSSLERRFWDFVYARRVLRHRQRPNIEPWQGRVQVAVQAAAVLRDNEAVMICSDAPPIPADRGRTVEVPFLGRHATLLPGVVTLAEITGAKLLMVFAHRSEDYRHQVIEISPPVSLDGGSEAAFGRCAAAMDAAIRANPADWYFWFHKADLVELGLLPGMAVTASAN